jgi:hypothetical protein
LKNDASPQNARATKFAILEKGNAIGGVRYIKKKQVNTNVAIILKLTTIEADLEFTAITQCL